MFCRQKIHRQILALTTIFSFLFFGSINLIYSQEATGGDEIIELELDGKNYWIHVFKTVGNHTFTPLKNLDLQVLVVAGGGKGGNSVANQPSGGYDYYDGGGGGAGGLVFHDNYIVSSLIDITVTVGGQSGDSVFDVIVAKGGGAAGDGLSNNARNGGCGGGGGGGSFNGGNTNQFTLGNSAGGEAFGYSGEKGGGLPTSGKYKYAIGGNGGGVGQNYSHIFGNNFGNNGVFAKGGVRSTIRYAAAGMPNTGNGGNGSRASGVGTSNRGVGGAGGSGIVIVRYEVSSFNLNPNDSSTNITPTKSSPNFTISGTIDYPEDGEGNQVIVSATLGGIERQFAIPIIDDQRNNLPWHLTWTHDELSEGEYTNIEFTASDGIEETSANYTGKIIIDKTAPVCGTWNPPISNWRPRSSKSFTLSGSTDTGGSGIDIGGGVCNTGLNHGDQCVLEIKDQAGNTTLCSSPVNNIDIFPPQLQVTPPIPGWQGNKQNIIIEPSDDKTGIKRTAYSWLVNNLGSDCTGGDTYNPGDDLRLTIMGGENTLYTCTVDNAGNTTFSSQIYRYIPPMLTTPTLHKNVKPHHLYWNIESISETSSYVEVKGFFPKTKGNYNYALELIIPTINKSYSQALQTSPFSETHFTILIPTSDFNASKDNHTFSGPQKLKITDLDEMESTTTDLNLSFFFPIHQSNHRRDFNYFILAGDNRLNAIEE